jgi:hypothetical protein
MIDAQRHVITTARQGDAPRVSPIQGLGTRLIGLARAAAAMHMAQSTGESGRDEQAAGAISFRAGYVGSGGAFLQARPGAIHWEVEP